MGPKCVTAALATKPSSVPAVTWAVALPGRIWKQRMSGLLTSEMPWLPW